MWYLLMMFCIYKQIKNVSFFNSSASYLYISDTHEMSRFLISAYKYVILPTHWSNVNQFWLDRLQKYIFRGDPLYLYMDSIGFAAGVGD